MIIDRTRVFGALLDFTGIIRALIAAPKLPHLPGSRRPKDCGNIIGGDGVSDYAWSLRQSHDVREYCVQYRETDLDFIERILAEEGIFYHFEHGDGEHTVVFSDDASVVNNIEKPAIYNVGSLPIFVVILSRFLYRL